MIGLNIHLQRNWRIFAAWTFWVVQIPYLAQKPQTILIALGWVFQGHSGIIDELPIPLLVTVCLAFFLVVLYISTKGIRALKFLGTIAGTAMFVMSILFILLAVGVPLIKPDLQLATGIWIRLKRIFQSLIFHTLQRLRFLSSRSEGQSVCHRMCVNSRIQPKNFQKE